MFYSRGLKHAARGPHVAREDHCAARDAFWEFSNN